MRVCVRIYSITVRAPSLRIDVCLCVCVCVCVCILSFISCVVLHVRCTPTSLQTGQVHSTSIKLAMKACPLGSNTHCPLHHPSVWVPAQYPDEGPRIAASFQGVALRTEFIISTIDHKLRSSDALLAAARRVQLAIPGICYCDTPMQCPTGFHVPFDNLPQLRASSRLSSSLPSSNGTEGGTSAQPVLPEPVSISGGYEVAAAAASSTRSEVDLTGTDDAMIMGRLVATLCRISDLQRQMPPQARTPAVTRMLKLGEQTLSAVEMTIREATQHG
jgi:hypothetical protein